MRNKFLGREEEKVSKSIYTQLHQKSATLHQYPDYLISSSKGFKGKKITQNNFN